MKLSRLKNHLINIPGWRTHRKIVVIESDDWGAIRMPSIEIYKKLLKAGIPVDLSKYDSLDCLENRDDLEALFDVQSKFRDIHGNPPLFTFNTVMGNPDFEKIRKSNFSEYHNEHFFQSYIKYYQKDLQEIWKYGMKKEYIRPQFHAREHLNVSLWMKDLQNRMKLTRKAFDYGFFGLKTNTSSPFQKHYLAAYRTENWQELGMLQKILEDGLSEFETTFGYRSKTLIACNYVWPKEIEPHLAHLGIKGFQGQRAQIRSNPSTGKTNIKYHYTGQRNSSKQVYTVRNVLFEPYEKQNIDWVEQALSGIENSFYWHKPAIISSHRINYVGGMSLEHRAKNLNLLGKLFEKLLQRHPDVQFMASDELVSLIN